MIRALRHALGAVTSLAGVIVLVAPTTLLLLWSLAYVGAVFEGAGAPGIPIQYEYNAPDGKFIIRAESYTFDSPNKSLRLNRPAILSPSGNVVARARLLVATLRDGVAFVGIDRLEGEIVRRSDGSFSVAGALPVSEGEPSKQAVCVEVRHATVRYVDQFGPGAPPVIAESDFVRVSASGDTFVARADLRLRGSGLVQASLSQDPEGGFQIRLKLPQLDCGTLLDHAFNWLPRDALRDWQPIRADRLVVRGTVDLAFPPVGEPRLAANVEADGTGVEAKGLLKQASVRARGQAGLESFVGTLDVRDPGSEAAWTGTIAWAERPGFDGHARASVKSRRSVWPIVSRLLPSGLEFDNARFDGSVRWQGRRYDIRGEAAAARLAFRGDSLEEPTLNVAATSDAVAAQVVRATWLNHPLAATLRLDLTNRQVAGFAELPKADLAVVGRRAGLPQLRGTGSIRAVLSGTISEPKVGYVARGAAAWDHGGKVPQYLGLFEAGGRLDRRELRLGRLALTSQNGAYTASGTYNLSTQELDFRLKGGALSIHTFAPQASGLAFFQGELRGTPALPSFSGTAELDGAEVGGTSVPVVRSEVFADRRVVRLTSLTAENGTSKLVGNVAWGLGSGKLDGQFEADELLLADYLGSEYAGAVNVRSGLVSGTFEKPTVTALVVGGPISAYGLSAQSIAGRLDLNRERVKVVEGRVELAEGAVSLTGEYAYDGQGLVAATFDGVGLAAIPTYDSGIDLGGKLHGALSARIASGLVSSGSADLKLFGVVTNGWLVGDGSVLANGSEGVWTGELGIGANDRFIVGENLRFDSAEKAATGDLSLLNVRIEDVLAAVRKTRKEPSELERRLLESTTGLATAFVSVSGGLDDPNVLVRDFQLSGLEVAGRAAGNVSLQASRTSGSWRIDPTRWTDGSSSLRVQGTIDRDGRADLSADVEDFDLNWLQALGIVDRALPIQLDSSVAVGGHLDNPLVQGSLRLEYTGIEGDGALRPSADFDTFELRDRVIRAEGMFLANSFSGKIKGRAPLGAFLNDGRDAPAEPVDLRVDLRERDVNELTDAMPWLDTGRTEAKLGGWMSLGGTPDKWEINGQATLRGTSFAASGMSTALQSLEANAAWDEGTLRIAGRAKGSKGGDVSIDGAVAFGPLLESGKSLEEILSGAALSGSLSVEGLKLSESLRKGEKVEATIQSATVQLGGNVRTPTVSGEAVVSGADVTIPTLDDQAAPATFPVSPRFDNLVLRIDDRAKIRAAATVMDVTGQGAINGTLEEPRVAANLTVLGGTFSLPSAPITLEEGGTMAFKYESSGTSESVARLDLNLEGRTAITARRLSDVAERYDVTLSITGNLLENQGLTLRASSDPPDLSQDEILAILGQKDLIEQLARGTNANNQQPIREMLYSFALPALSTSVTRGLAYGLGLDQLSIEYNAYDNFTFTGSKTLAKGLTLVGRGQLVKPVDGPSRWEMKLYYRLPSRNVILSRTRLGAGIAYDRPWRLTLDYTIRF